MSTVDANDTIARLMANSRTIHEAAAEALRERGIDPVERVCTPPSDAELRHTYWFEFGYLQALEDLGEELELEAERTSAVLR